MRPARAGVTTTATSSSFDASSSWNPASNRRSPGLPAPWRASSTGSNRSRASSSSPAWSIPRESRISMRSSCSRAMRAPTGPIPRPSRGSMPMPAPAAITQLHHWSGRAPSRQRATWVRRPPPTSREPTGCRRQVARPTGSTWSGSRAAPSWRTSIPWPWNRCPTTSPGSGPCGMPRNSAPMGSGSRSTCAAGSTYTSIFASPIPSGATPTRGSSSATSGDRPAPPPAWKTAPTPSTTSTMPNPRARSLPLRRAGARSPRDHLHAPRRAVPRGRWRAVQQ